MGDVEGFEIILNSEIFLIGSHCMRNIKLIKFLYYSLCAMVKWIFITPHIKLGLIIFFSLISFSSKVENCDSSLNKSERYFFFPKSLSANFDDPRYDYDFFNKPEFFLFRHYRKKSLRKIFGLEKLKRSSYKNKRILEDHNTWPVKRVAEIEGDIILGGLMMIHEREDENICGPIMPQGGIQALECMLYTIDWINNQNFLPGIKLGCYVLDDCDKDTYGLEQAVDFIKGSMSNIDEGSYHCSDGSSPTIRHKKISGVLGAASSVTSIQVANLLRLFKIPQVSFFSTSPELSNKNRFEYFLRTVPSDLNQADAMVQLVQRFHWTYISILYEESTYGIQAFTVLEELLLKNNICIAVKERLTKDSGVAGESYYDNIVKRIMSKPSARGVIIFGSDQEVAGVMRAVRRNNATGCFSWIGSDGWSARALVFEGNEDQVEGTLSVQPRAQPVVGFENYFLGLRVENNPRNPWFTEFWEHFFNCKWPNSIVTPYNQKPNFCTGDEIMSRENGYEAERQLQFVSDAVLVFAHALKAMHKELCGGIPGLCAKMDPVDGYRLLSYLKNVSFKGLSGEEFRFSENGDGPARYNIIHFKQIKPHKYQWVRVGKYEDGVLELNISQVRFRADEPEIPRSVCSLPCDKGEAKKFVEGEKCCWHCLSCTEYQILHSDTMCYECPLGYLPNKDKNACEEIPLRYMRIHSGWAIGALTFSSLGITGTLFTILAFIKYNNTPVVKASGRELSYVLLMGILMCYSMTFILVLKPTDLRCGAQQTGIGFSFTTVYSALLTKTNRISRIFNAGAKSTKRPSFTSPKSQLFICGCIAVVQLIISALWLGFLPPSAINFYRTRNENLLLCAATVDTTYMVAFAYPMLLIVICTVYAVLTRKIPEAFNESKYIGFTMYTTCIIWLAFIPIYFTTSSHVEINTFMMSATISLSATVTLLCLFFHKMKIILFHPEKNIRQSIMTARYTHPTPSCTRNNSEIVDEGMSVATEHHYLQVMAVDKSRCRNCGTQTTKTYFPETVVIGDSKASVYRRLPRCVSCTVFSQGQTVESKYL